MVIKDLTEKYNILLNDNIKLYERVKKLEAIQGNKNTKFPYPTIDQRLDPDEVLGLLGAPKNRYLSMLMMPILVFRLKCSGYFDSEFYLTKYPDVRLSGMSASRHFITHGIYEGRTPRAR